MLFDVKWGNSNSQSLANATSGESPELVDAIHIRPCTANALTRLQRWLRSLVGSQVRRLHEHSEGHLKDCYFDSFVNTVWTFATVGLASPEVVDEIQR